MSLGFQGFSIFDNFSNQVLIFVRNPSVVASLRCFDNTCALVLSLVFGRTNVLKEHFAYYSLVLLKALTLYVLLALTIIVTIRVV